MESPANGVRRYYFDSDIPDAWPRQGQAGAADYSSLRFSDHVGLRWEAVHPFYPKDPVPGERIPILQVVMAVIDTALTGAGDPWQEAVASVVRDQNASRGSYHQFASTSLQSVGLPETAKGAHCSPPKSVNADVVALPPLEDLPKAG